MLQIMQSDAALRAAGFRCGPLAEWRAAIYSRHLMVAFPAHKSLTIATCGAASTRIVIRASCRLQRN